MKHLKKCLASVLALCLATSILCVSASAAEPETETETFNPMRDNPRSEFWDGTNPFTDVETGPDYLFRDAWAYDIIYAWKVGLMNGVSDTIFAPDAPCTRAMAWTVLARAEGVKITGTDWAEKAQAWAMENGISDGTYPERAVTLQELITMVYRQMGCPTRFNENLSNVIDLGLEGVSDWAREAVYWGMNSNVGPMTNNNALRHNGIQVNDAATRYDLASAAASLHKMAWIRQDYLPYAYGSSQSYNMLINGMY